MTTTAPILAVTDFSAPSRHAADRAARLAKEAGAALSLMHVTPAGTLQDLRQAPAVSGDPLEAAVGRLAHALAYVFVDVAQRELGDVVRTLLVGHAVGRPGAGEVGVLPRRGKVATGGRAGLVPVAGGDDQGVVVRVHREVAADRWVDELDEKMRLWATQPLIGRSRDELAPGLRSLAFGRYVVFYEALSEGIDVVRVPHGSRDIDANF